MLEFHPNRANPSPLRGTAISITVTSSEPMTVPPPLSGLLRRIERGHAERGRELGDTCRAQRPPQEPAQEIDPDRPVRSIEKPYSAQACGSRSPAAVRTDRRFAPVSDELFAKGSGSGSAPASVSKRARRSWKTLSTCVNFIGLTGLTPAGNGRRRNYALSH
jgi:hypothetical protein